MNGLRQSWCWGVVNCTTDALTVLDGRSRLEARREARRLTNEGQAIFVPVRVLVTIAWHTERGGRDAD